MDDINKEISIDWSNTPIRHIVNSHARFVLEIKSHADNSETVQLVSFSFFQLISSVSVLLILRVIYYEDVFYFAWQ